MFRNAMAPLTSCVLLAVACTTFGAQPQPVKIVLVGDSTVNDEGGWGSGLRASFGPEVTVLNLAKNGRSSKSFRDEGLWEQALAARPNFILIQFGHNDVPGKGPDRETDAKTAYRQNMARYVDEARAIGAEPVLVTSIVRRNFTPDGKIKADSLAPYVEAVRSLAAEKKVPLIDLYTLTREQAEKLGPAGCAEIDARDKDGKPDHTHLGPKGRQEIGAIAARELVKVESVLRPNVSQPGRR
jgi:lysophospholipase L1-like esterase